MQDGGSGRLAGKVALVTGGASGIGRACVLRYAQEGADVAIADRNTDVARELLESIEREYGRRAHLIEVDVSEPGSVDAMVERAAGTLGPIDTLLAAAGIAGAEPAGAAPRSGRELVELPVAAWERVLAVNLTGVMLSCRAVAQHMIANGTRGTLVTVSSTAGRRAVAGVGDYCVSKAGVIMLTQVLALELAPHGIRVNALAPGFVETPMTHPLLDDPQRRAQIERSIPLGRLGSTSEMANAALHLASDESTFTTGQTLYLNGGAFMG